MAPRYKRQTRCKTRNNEKDPTSFAKKVSRVEMHALRSYEKSSVFYSPYAYQNAPIFFKALARRL